MCKFCIFFYIVLQCFLSTESQFVYRCNFDGFTFVQSCFDPLISPIEYYGFISNTSDIVGPLSDVTSIKTPTSNGEYCSLPYRLSAYRWDIYFCNRGSCETTSGSNGNCTKGSFGRTQYQLTNQFQSYLLRNLINRTNEIDGIDEQCLIYYYYFPTTVQNELIIVKEEIDGNNVTIDRVNSTPFNGWIERRVNFFAENSKYKIYFNIRKVSGTVAPFGMFDEISIEQGNCTESPSTTTRTTQVSTTTSSIITNSETSSTWMTSTLTNPIITTELTTLNEMKSESQRTTSSEGPDSTTTTTTTTSTQSSTTVTTTMTTTTTTSTISTRSTMNTSTVIITTTRTTTVERSTSSMTTENPFVTLTSSSAEMFTETKPKEDSPSNNMTTIIIGVVVSVVVIVGAGGGTFIWHKRIKAKKLLSNFDQPLSDSNDRNHRPSFMELSQIRNESSF